MQSDLSRREFGLAQDRFTELWDHLRVPVAHKDSEEGRIVGSSNVLFVAKGDGNIEK